MAACGDDQTWHCGGDAELLYSGHVWGENLAATGGDVYFTTFSDDPTTDLHSVMAVSGTCGAAPRTLWTGGAHELLGAGMAVIEGQVVFSEMTDQEQGPPAIYAVPVGGGPRTQLAVPATGGGFYSGFASDLEAAYVQDGDTFVRIPIDGSTFSVVGPASASNTDAAVMRGGAIVFTVVGGASGPGTTVFELDLAVMTVRTLGATDANGGPFDADDSAVYMPSSQGVAVISRAGLPPMHLGEGEWDGVIVGADGFYGFSGESIVWMPRAGGPPVTLASGLPNLFTLARDGAAVFAASLGDVYALHAPR